MKKTLGVFLCGLFLSVSLAFAEVVEVKLVNPSSHRLWLSDVRKP